MTTTNNEWKPGTVAHDNNAENNAAVREMLVDKMYTVAKIVKYYMDTEHLKEGQTVSEFYDYFGKFPLWAEFVEDHISDDELDLITMLWMWTKIPQFDSMPKDKAMECFHKIDEEMKRKQEEMKAKEKKDA